MSTTLKTPLRPTGDELLRVDDLTVHFRIRRGLRKKSDDIVHAADHVSLAIGPGQTLALVGESGCGKSTVARAILQLVEPTAGAISFMGTDLIGLKRRQRRTALREAQVVFQDPYS
ncbi:MAG TPA: ATP-binding cassette domain-containing protein, partial [Thermoleophilia bacterium]|nr:ATP-binding cassette domain-containing protein [Thermoleophilia bacterium]